MCIYKWMILTFVPWHEHSGYFFTKSIVMKSLTIIFLMMAIFGICLAGNNLARDRRRINCNERFSAFNRSMILPCAHSCSQNCISLLDSTLRNELGCCVSTVSYTLNDESLPMIYKCCDIEAPAPCNGAQGLIFSSSVLLLFILNHFINWIHSYSLCIQTETFSVFRVLII